MRSVAEGRAIPGRGLGATSISESRTYSRKEDGRQITYRGRSARGAHRDIESRWSRRRAAEKRRDRGVALNHLVGRRFRVGEVEVRGLRLCEPCAYMEHMSGRPVRAGLVHRGGLRAEILTEGTIRVGDEVQGSKEPSNP